MKKIKLSFTGDIMCSMEQNQACKTTEGYDYSSVFEKASAVLSNCDYLVGNLETPLAGADMGYTNEQYSFNTPLQFAKELRSLGFNLLSTANNHCLDREIQGLFNTIDVLDDLKISHLGTYKDTKSRDKCFVREINGIKIAFIAYTYGTNAFYNHVFLTKDQQYAVNLTQPQETLDGAVHLLDGFDEIQKNVDCLYNDKNIIYQTKIKGYLDKIEEDVENCRLQGAEFIVFIMHSGGQYNETPDPYTLMLAEHIRKIKVDIIVGHHPHVIHECRVIDGCPVVYSLGNFTCTPEINIKRTDARFAADYNVLLNLHIIKNDLLRKVK